MEKDIFASTPGEVARQAGVFALCGVSPEPGGDSKRSLLDLLKGSSSPRLRDVDSPQIGFGELKTIAVKQAWATARPDGLSYVDMAPVAPFGINDAWFKELSLREKGAFLVIFLDQMEKFDSTANRHYVVLPNTYKDALAKERGAKK